MLITSRFFNNLGLISSGILHVSPREAFKLCGQGAIIVDVREEYLNRFKTFNVDKIIYCPFSTLKKKYKDLPKNNALIVADSTGIRSKQSAFLLIDHGFNNIANLAGGLVEWERGGLPIKIDKTERLSGSCACMLRKRERK
jgi:rhodanese-related sulfurtransferase